MTKIAPSEQAQLFRVKSGMNGVEMLSQDTSGEQTQACDTDAAYAAAFTEILGFDRRRAPTKSCSLRRPAWFSGRHSR